MAVRYLPSERSDATLLHNPRRSRHHHPLNPLNPLNLLNPGRGAALLYPLYA